MKPLEYDPAPLDQALNAGLQAVMEWKHSQDPIKIKKRVTDLLEKNLEQGIITLLGFDYRWGKWEVDHCNGRSGESSVGDYMKQQHSVAIKEFFDSLDIKTLITPTLRNKLSAVVKKEMEWRLEGMVRDRINIVLAEQMSQLVKELVPTPDISKHLAAIKLIEG